MRAAAKIGLTALLLLTAVGAVWSWPARVPPPPLPSDASGAGAPAANGEAAVGSPGQSDARAEPRRDVTAEVEEWTDAAAVFLSGARRNDKFAVVLAEVLELGPHFRGGLPPDDVEEQYVRLRLLADDAANHLGKYQELHLPYSPMTSILLHGVATPFGALQPGQVREVVLGWPDVGVLTPLFKDRGWWLVLAGPPVARPPDPLLDRVPAPLTRYLARPGHSVFRGRVRSVGTRHSPGNERFGLPTAVEQLQIEVLEVVVNPRGFVVGKEYDFSNVPPLLPDARDDSLRLPPGTATVGAEYWFASEGGGPFAFLRAAVPVR